MRYWRHISQGFLESAKQVVGAKSNQQGQQLFHLVQWMRLLQHKCTWHCAAAGTLGPLAPKAARRRSNTLENVQHKKNHVCKSHHREKRVLSCINYSPNMSKTIWSCWGRRRDGRSTFEWKMSSRSFGKRNSPSTGICSGILCSECSLLQVIAVMYQTCWFKWLWCRIWEFMTEDVESDKSDKTYFQCNWILPSTIV